mgnify:CR=1 FL=1
MAENWIPYPELAELIGRDAADTLCRTYGGIPLYIPRYAGSDYPLSRLIGFSALRALVLGYGGLRITVPNGRKTAPVKDEVLSMIERGLPHEEIAMKAGVTERYVRMLASRKKRRGPVQLSLL